MTRRYVYGEPLTKKDVAILRLAAQGFTNFQIAQALSLSHETIKTYFKLINDKLDTLNRTHAVARALVRGYISLPNDSEETPPS